MKIEIGKFLVEKKNPSKMNNEIIGETERKYEELFRKLDRGSDGEGFDIISKDYSHI